GRRWEALRLLKRAETLRVRDRNDVSSGSPGSSLLPSLAEIRSQAVAALLTRDGRRLREIKMSNFGNAFAGVIPAVSADGWLAVAPAMPLTSPRPESPRLPK